MMFTNDDLKKETIDGQPYVTFQPNTIVYAVPYKSAGSVLSAKMGVVWHTSYSGKTMEDMSAKFGVKLSQIPKTSEAWMQDATYRDVSGTATFNKKETVEITKILSSAGKTFHSLKPAVLSKIVEDKTINVLIKTFNNTKVRSGEKIKNTRMHTSGVIAFAYDKMKKDVDKVKREDTKKSKQLAMDEKMKFFRSNDLTLAWQYQNVKSSTDLLIAPTGRAFTLIYRYMKPTLVDSLIRTTPVAGEVPVDEFAPVKRSFTIA